MMLHGSELMLWLVNVKFCEVTLNGPPTGPLEAKPLVGDTTNGWLTWSVNSPASVAWDVQLEKIRFPV